VYDDPTIILKGGLSLLKTRRAMLAQRGIAAQIVAPPGAGRG
jgi:hypothetical protein